MSWNLVKSPRGQWVNPRWSHGHVCAGFGGSLGSGNFSEWPWRNQGVSFWNFQGIPLLSLVILRFCKCQHRGCVNDIIPNLGLHAACWAHVMCHHELCPAPVSDPIQVSYTEKVLGYMKNGLWWLTETDFSNVALVSYWTLWIKPQKWTMNGVKPYWFKKAIAKNGFPGAWLDWYFLWKLYSERLSCTC